MKKQEKLKTKGELLEDVIFNLFETEYPETLDYIKDLCREALKDRTKEELKGIIYGQ